MGIRTFENSGTTSKEITALEKENRNVARKAAAEGIVLLHNDGVLPLKEKEIAVFGGGASYTMKGGTGSGDVNERESVSVLQGLRNAGFIIANEDWLSDYDKRYEEGHVAWRDSILDVVSDPDEQAFFEYYASHPFEMPKGRPISAEDFGDTKTAIYVLSRVCGEGADRTTEKGDYYPTDTELTELRAIASLGKQIVLLLNIGAPIDMQEICKIQEIKGIVLISQPGEDGGNAVADVLTGKETPSGKLTDTWAIDYHDFPIADTFSHQNGDIYNEKYEGGIYVGYRYFDSFNVKPLYPFGYGLSYTTFDVRGQGVFVNTERLQVIATVTNTGKTYSGKDVVQVYATLPQRGMTKEFKRLCGFAKTKILAPGESQTLTIQFPAKALASFDEERGAFVTEKGLYGIWTGDSSDNIELMGLLTVAEDAVIEEVPAVCPLQQPLDEIEPDRELAKKMEQSWQKEAVAKRLTAIPFAPTPERTAEYRMDDVDRMAHAKAAGLSVEQMIPLCIGEITASQNYVGSSSIRVPGAAGETTSSLQGDGIAPVTMADGPAGLRLTREYEVDASGKALTVSFGQSLEGGFFIRNKKESGNTKYYQYCTAFPIGTMLAQTWNTDLVEEVGRAVAKEMEIFHISWWLAPGMNIHRNPLCGRNFEYYSEDPVVSGYIAAAMTNGVQDGNGTGTTIKHFACNNQEDNRMGSDSIISQRALREIYLRGFEIAVKLSQPMSIMTSYNLVNGVHSANNADLCTEVARKEWGFKGMIMTDWTTTFPNGGSTPYECIKAGNDLIMPGYQGDFDDINKAVEEGKLTEDELRACAERMINIIARTNAYEDSVSYRTRFAK